MDINDIIPNPEPQTVPIAEHLELVKQRDNYQADIEFTTRMIARLLLDIGLFNDQMQLQPISRVLRKLPGMLINQSSLIKKFEYLGELGGIIEKYSISEKTIII